MTNEESMAEAERLLREAGWTASLQAPWRGRFVAPGGLIGGVDPHGNGHVKNYIRVPCALAAELGLDPADHPDEPHENAAWLIARFSLAPASEEADSAGHKAHGEAGESVGHSATEHDAPGAASAPGEPGDMGDGSRGYPDAEFQRTLVRDGAAANPDGEPESADFLDADFEALTPLPPPSDPEPAPAAEPSATDSAQARFYGLDDLDRRRNLRIGDVVQISMERQDAIWADSGTTEEAYEALVSQVMRETVQGVYRGSAEVFDQFTQVQTYANAARAVAATEQRMVRFLRNATREDVEAFDPQEGWP